jgi:lysophospholipase L1-like esterase
VVAGTVLARARRPVAEPVKRLCALAALLVLVAGGCAGDHRDSGGDATTTSTVVPPDLTSALRHVTEVTALGDSVPYGTACDCSPYPEQFGRDVATVAGHPVDTANDAVPGYETADVIHQLQDETSVIDHVRRSGVVLVEIGANDVEFSSSCGTTLSCYEPEVPAVQRNLDEIVSLVHQLTAGHEVTVVLLDYWNVWLGGQYAEAHGPAYVTTADALTADIDQTIVSTAHATGSIYVDLRTAFRGPDHDQDETDLLAPDGDHPNAAGQERITDALDIAVAESIAKA